VHKQAVCVVGYRFFKFPFSNFEFSDFDFQMEHFVKENTDGGRVRSLSGVQETVERLGPWFQNLHLPNGIQTAPKHSLGDYPLFKWEAIAPILPTRLDGWRVLDIGCNAGFYCFELARRGAEIVGIDHDPHYLAQAKWASQQFGLEDRIAFKEMQVYDLIRVSDVFDLVLFMGVFYHLRYPLLALDAVVRRVGKLLLFQTLSMPGDEVYSPTAGLDINDRAALLEAGWPKMAFFEHEFAGDPTNWWAPNHACVEAVLRSSGLRILERPTHEVYLCEPDRENPSSSMAWDMHEFEAATRILQDVSFNSMPGRLQR
jgi:tRNA (mo5U34)-methyltransferase